MLHFVFSIQTSFSRQRQLSPLVMEQGAQDLWCNRPVSEKEMIPYLVHHPWTAWQRKRSMLNCMDNFPCIHCTIPLGYCFGPSLPQEDSSVITSTHARKFLCGLHSQSLALIGPLEGPGHRPVVIVNERQHPGLQILDRSERTACEQLAH